KIEPHARAVDAEIGFGFRETVAEAVELQVVNVADDERVDDALAFARKLLAHRVVRASGKAFYRRPLILQAKPLTGKLIEERLPLLRLLLGPVHIAFDPDLLRHCAVPDVYID